MSGDSSDNDGDVDCESPVNRPTHHDFIAALESLKVLNLYASFEDGPRDGRTTKAILSIKMLSIGIRHEPKKKQTTLHQFFLHQEKYNIIL